MQRAEWLTYDLRSRAELRRKPHPDIVVIKIDDDSLKRLHQWPWPRSIHAELIRKLSRHPPKALAFDVFFVDPFTSDPKGDRALVEETRKYPWVVHAVFGESQGFHLANVTWPFPSLLQAASHLGYVNAFIDEDGSLRGAMPQMELEGKKGFLLSVVAASLYLGRPIDQLVPLIALDPHGQFLVHFIGPQSRFPEVSYADVLQASDQDLAEVFENKAVLVGAFATGTYDHYPTPVSKNSPGVLFHANVIDNLIRMCSMRYVGLRWTYLWIAVLGVFCGLFLARFSAGVGALGVALVGASYWGIAQWLFTRKNVVLDVAGPLFALFGAYVAIVIYRFFTEEREKRMVKSFFSQQVSGELLDVLMENPDVLKKAGERREMTVFFSDVAGFTSISERLRPEELVELLNQYLTSMTEVIFENGGYVDKYMGDGIMAFWNGLLKQPDHAERACRCALGSKQRLKDLNEDLKKRGLVPLGARIGINTGEMAAGYMGSVQKKQFTVMGDNVNLGSRLEGANKAFGTSIMISEFTYEMVQDKYDVRFLDRILVPGKAKPVRVYELLAEKGTLDERWQKALPLYHEAIQLFSDRQFARSREKFLELEPILGQDKACMAYLHRAEEFMAVPPPEDWDGVFEVKSK